ncbi:MAG: hypothetical protein FWF56_00785 [Firmicutes bacterium]|nr:hypothetical protein [Bacillota bacterium]MCL1953721.1 hypothetical protein [Bacillota bacterium]
MPSYDLENENNAKRKKRIIWISVASVLVLALLIVTIVVVVNNNKDDGGSGGGGNPPTPPRPSINQPELSWKNSKDIVKVGETLELEIQAVLNQTGITQLTFDYKWEIRSTLEQDGIVHKLESNQSKVSIEVGLGGLDTDNTNAFFVVVSVQAHAVVQEEKLSSDWVDKTLEVSVEDTEIDIEIEHTVKRERSAWWWLNNNDSSNQIADGKVEFVDDTGKTDRTAIIQPDASFDHLSTFKGTDGAGALRKSNSLKVDFVNNPVFRASDSGEPQDLVTFGVHFNDYRTVITDEQYDQAYNSQILIQLARVDDSYYINILAKGTIGAMTNAQDIKDLALNADYLYARQIDLNNDAFSLGFEINDKSKIDINLKSSIVDESFYSIIPIGSKPLNAHNFRSFVLHADDNITNDENGELAKLSNANAHISKITIIGEAFEPNN